MNPQSRQFLGELWLRSIPIVDMQLRGSDLIREFPPACGSGQSVQVQIPAVTE